VAEARDLAKEAAVAATQRVTRAAVLVLRDQAKDRNLVRTMDLVPRVTRAAVDTDLVVTEMEVVPRDIRVLVPVPKVLATDPVLREAPNLDHTMDTLEVATEEMAVDPANTTTAD